MKTGWLLGGGLIALFVWSAGCGSSDGDGTPVNLSGVRDGGDQQANDGGGGTGDPGDGGMSMNGSDGGDAGKASDGGASLAFGAPNGTSSGFFGEVLALSADGNTLAVGSPGEASNATGINGNQTSSSAANAGAVFVFARQAGGFALQAYVKASNTLSGGGFGTSVALSADGNTMLVGAVGDRSNATGVGGNQADQSLQFAGAAYMFARTGTTWSQSAFIKASNNQANLRFGRTVSLSGDGATAVVGSILEPSSSTGINGTQSDTSDGAAGAAYVFALSGGTWAQQAYVKSSNTAPNQQFAFSTALSTDGNTMVVGAPGEASNATGVNGNQGDQSLDNPGAAYVFLRNGTTWTQQAYLKASNTRANATFGHAVTVSGDGNTIAVGSNAETSNATGINGNQTDTSDNLAGAAYVYTRAAAAWTQQAYLKASDTAANSEFGKGIALSSGGDTLVVGAPTLTGSQGAAYPFTRSAGVWTAKTRMLSGTPQQPARFGNAIGLSSDGTKMVIGSPDAANGPNIRVGIVEAF